MSAAALYSLDSPACYRSWCPEPANFYEAAGGLGGGANLAELSAAAPAMYEDESAIDFSSYIDSMSAVPNLELCNDELFADLFNSNHKPERGWQWPLSRAAVSGQRPRHARRCCRRRLRRSARFPPARRGRGGRPRPGRSSWADPPPFPARGAPRSSAARKARALKQTAPDILFWAARSSRDTGGRSSSKRIFFFNFFFFLIFNKKKKTLKKFSRTAEKNCI
uniref:CCAAT enhancer binding protein delta n=1 Tax=Nothoprocta perdicaria TaxID=30464 RepID=A0A8C6Z292_NOTPE